MPITDLKLDEVMEELYHLQEENQSLKCDNDFLERKVSALKIENSRLTIQRNKLEDDLNKVTSMSMFEFANKFCNESQLEEAGHAFAKSLLGGGA